MAGSDIVVLPVAGSSGLFSFFGFTSDTAFTSVTFQGLANDVYGIDNVSYIPEPATGLMVVGGVGAMLMGIRSRRRRMSNPKRN